MYFPLTICKNIPILIKMTTRVDQLGKCILVHKINLIMDNTYLKIVIIYLHNKPS